MRTWQLIIAPWSEAQRAALRRFGSDALSVVLCALRTDGDKLECFVTLKAAQRASWLSSHIIEGVWRPATAPTTREARWQLLAQYQEGCDRSQHWRMGVNVPALVEPEPIGTNFASTTLWHTAGVQTSVASSAQALGGAHLPSFLPPLPLALRPPLLPPPPPHHLQSPSTPPPPETPAQSSIPAPPSPEDQIGLASELWEILQRDQAEEGEVRGLTAVRGHFAIRSEDGRTRTPFAMASSL